jgi:tetratricopeptide (TPR) repeat protein
VTKDADEVGGGTGRPGLTEEDELALALSRGRDALVGGRASEAAELLEDATRLAQGLGDGVAEAEAAGMLAQARLRLGEIEEAGRLAERGRALARACGDEAAERSFGALLDVVRSGPQDRELNIAFGDGRAALVAGDLARAAERLGLARELARSVGRPVAETAATLLLAQTRLEGGDAGAAIDLAEEARALAEAAGDDRAASRALEIVERARNGAGPIDAADDLEQGMLALTSGDVERGIALLERARDGARAAGEAAREASASGALAQAYVEVDRCEEAVVHARRGLEIAESLGEADAARSFRELVDIASAGPERHALARALHRGAETMASGDSSGAATAFEDAQRQARALAHEASEATACGLLAQVYLDLGRRADAEAAVRRGLDLSRASGDEAAVSFFEKILEKIGE